MTVAKQLLRYLKENLDGRIVYTIGNFPRTGGKKGRHLRPQLVQKLESKSETKTTTQEVLLWWV